MSRIGAAICGEVDPSQPVDYNWFPWQISQNLIAGATPTNGFSLSYIDGLDLYWLVAQVEIDYSITSTFNPGTYSNTVDVSTVRPAATDETNLLCATSVGAGLTDSDMTIGFTLFSYDTGPKTVGYFVSIAGTGSGPQLSTTPLVGSPSPVTCTILGTTVQLYDRPGESTSGHLTITKKSYWAHDNGLTGGTNGPIYNTTSGAILITPIPIGL